MVSSPKQDTHGMPEVSARVCCAAKWHLPHESLHEHPPGTKVHGRNVDPKGSTCLSPTIPHSRMVLDFWGLFMFELRIGWPVFFESGEKTNPRKANVRSFWQCQTSQHEQQNPGWPSWSSQEKDRWHRWPRPQPPLLPRLHLSWNPRCQRRDVCRVYQRAISQAI